MESHFASLRNRDASVSMLRVKMARRRSQSQKENRERVLNTRRHLDKLPELEMSSQDVSVSKPNISTIQEKTTKNIVVAKNVASEERQKQLARWKERKALEKEKEKRERERKGVFKTGIYHPKDTFVFPAKAKETKVRTVPSQSPRVTRSMKQLQLQQMQEPLKMQHSNAVERKGSSNTRFKVVKTAVDKMIVVSLTDVAAVEKPTRSCAAPTKPAPSKTKILVCKVEPAVRAPSTRSAVKAVPLVKDNPWDMSADVRTTRSKSNNARLPKEEKIFKEALCSTAPPPLPESEQVPETQVPEDKPCTPSSTFCSKEEDFVVDRAPADSIAAVYPVEAQSFAPEGFVFQAPNNLSFKFEPLTPHSAEAFLSPNLSFSLPPFPMFQAESSLQTSPTLDPATAAGSLESKHDVPYFRSEIASETDRLTKLCAHWEAKVEDEAIPEEMRDRMRTAVGQARLLMKERFKQFGGLVDDCELGRGEKITTCTDLQGFWDMVYCQVEDVNKKFDALKEAESRDWVEEYKPPPRRKKVVKNPSVATANPTGTKAAAKSRLAAVKAAMKARQQAVEKAAKVAGNDDDDDGANSQELQPRAEAQQTDSVVFDGGFFMVESPAKLGGSLRRSSRLIASMLSQTPPCINYLSPRRVTRRSLALAPTPVRTATPSGEAACTPSQHRLTHAQTQEPLPETPKDAGNVSRYSSAVKEALSPSIPLKEGPKCQSERGSGLTGPPPISVVEEQAEAGSFDLHSPSCEMLPASQAPEISPQSLASSLLVTPTHPPITTPVEVQESVCFTPHCFDVEDISGLDIERYLQPSQRCSLSLGEMVAVETLSPMAVDIEMMSPRGETQDSLTHQDARMSDSPPAVSSLLIPESPQVQTADSAMLLFTPDLKDRIRQSVCPSDLMVFTPPL